MHVAFSRHLETSVMWVELLIKHLKLPQTINKRTWLSDCWCHFRYKSIYQEYSGQCIASSWHYSLWPWEVLWALGQTFGSRAICPRPPFDFTLRFCIRPPFAPRCTKKNLIDTSKTRVRLYTRTVRYSSVEASTFQGWAPRWWASWRVGNECHTV